MDSDDDVPLVGLVKWARPEKTTSFKPDIAKVIFDENLKRQVEHSIKLFDPMSKLINMLLSTRVSIADAAEEWLKLQLPEGFDEYLPSLKN
ncbi:hypothetical protein ILUMI_13869, partial [Ignelater luminosus]